MTIRMVLCGTRSFGEAALSLLLDRADVDVAAVSAPTTHVDGTVDRLYARARALDVPIIPAGHLRAHTLPAGTDLILAAHSHDVIGRRTRSAARLGAIGYHPSLLPLHRGRDAVRWTIRDRDRVAGGTVYWLNDTIDGGPIAAQDWCLVRPDDDASTLWGRELFPMGLRLIASTLDDIARGTLTRIPQDHALATWEPSLDRPPLYRPELPELGDGGWRGYRVVVRRDPVRNGCPAHPKTGA